ncbi:IS630 family transposase [Pararhizobium qamdonense]|uniref:IS630 family transposase n=1 Tax=Pararhizobium qamdonense TaxID=3031126 RepID=UPI0023E0E09D|nr:IS630 family transposase [Pararhizobium qamdonense]
MFDNPRLCAEIQLSIRTGKQSIRKVARDRGISRNTVKRILSSDLPRSYRRPEQPNSKFKGVVEHLRLTPGLMSCGTRATAKDIHQRLEKEQTLKCSYSTVCRAFRAVRSDDNCWDMALDQITSLNRKEATAFLRRITSLPKLAAWKRMFSADKSAAKTRINVDERNSEAVNWIRMVQNGHVRSENLGVALTASEVEKILGRIRGGGRRNSNKGIAVLAKARGLSARVVCQYLAISRNSFRSYNNRYEQQGIEALFLNRRRRLRKAEDETLKAALFSLLHEPPSKHGFNRTSWKMDDLTSALKSYGNPACPAVVREITKAAGYKWRKAKIVLTSNDPEFSAKLAKVQETLRSLRPEEAFFSIDEFGPFSIKSKAGRVLVPPGESPAVAQWQKSRGCLILTAVLELSTNQVSHFYSTKKNTDEMIKMMQVLIEEYRDRSRIFMSWDAASWHVSRKLNEAIETHNHDADLRRYPTVELVPLPASAQFLNVIESVFSGMAKAIIHNSDYGSTDDAIRAIDRYFLDRNGHFRDNPKKAGRKIWGRERVPAVFSASHNCKDPAFR